MAGLSCHLFFMFVGQTKDEKQLLTTQNRCATIKFRTRVLNSVYSEYSFVPPIVPRKQSNITKETYDHI
jgi:hypothetical protein